MNWMRMIAITKHRWPLLKMACACAFVTNVYLMLRLFSWDSAVQRRENVGVTSLVRSSVTHPFAHLLPSQDLQTPVKRCTQPKLSILHDALSFAFHPMDPLKCSGSTFFYLQNGYLIPDNSMKDKLKMCEVFAIKRESDTLGFLEKLIETPGNTTVKITEDFVYVRCHFEDDIDDKFDAGQENEDHDRPAVKINIKSVANDLHKKLALFDNTSNIDNSFMERINVSISEEKNSNFRKNNLLPNKYKDSTFSHFSRVKRDIFKSIAILKQNKVGIERTTHATRGQTAESHVGSKSRVKIPKSKNTENRTVASFLRNVAHSGGDSSNKNKELELVLQGYMKKVITKYEKIVQNKAEEENSYVGIVNKGKVETKTQNNIQIKNIEKTLSDEEEDTYLDIKFTTPNESALQELDENFNNLNRDPGGFFDNQNVDDYPQLDEIYADIPRCDEEQFLVQVSPLKHVIERYNIRKTQQTKGLNVLMFGIDSMSNMAVKRKLPVTLNFLTKELDAVKFEGYNIVGDGTTQALLPMFLGKLQHEIPNILNRHLDYLDFVWKHYQKQGYVTMFAEDEPHLGVFNLRLPGFEELPTDHYMRYFWQIRSESHLKRDCSTHYCTGPTPNHQYLLQYLTDFFHKYHGIPHFAVGFSGELSHDEVNPSEYLDKDLHKFLAELKADGYLSNTVLILFGDHGSRKGKLRRILQGKIEERLPFLSMVFPKSFRKAHRSLFENLRRNAKGLTSPFDIHKTLIDLHDLSKVNSSDGQETKRGVSLFRPIPENRTCSEAGIDTHWCTCVQEKPVPKSDPVVKRAAQAVVDAINKLTQDDRNQCELLRLGAIHSASIVVPNLQVLKFHKTEETSNFSVSFGNTTFDMAELQVTIATDKCKGVFEATVQVHYHQDDPKTTDGAQLTFNVFEHDISRINTYGSQSACICKSNPRVMKFCCCSRFLRGEKLKDC